MAWSQVLDALRSVEYIDVGQLSLFYDALHCNLISRHEHAALFERLFKDFWALNPDDQKPTGCQPDDSGGADNGRATAWRRQSFFTQTETGGQAGQADTVALAYSPLALEQLPERSLSSFTPSALLYDNMVKLLEKLQRRTSRRMQHARRGNRLSLQRLLRKNIQFGGEPLVLEYLKRKTRKRRIVVFCDVSGSMDIYTMMTLQFVHALQRIIPMVEVFFFGTALTRVTPVLRSFDFNTVLDELVRNVDDWGGGTRIGYCLNVFNRTYGRRWLSSRTIVMIFSDGWDRGETGLLERQMQLIKGRVHKVLWFNPLIGTRDYQPVCRGMRAALPFIDYFLASRSLYDFRAIGQILEKIIV